jgi:hypothetical protein
MWEICQNLCQICPFLSLETNDFDFFEMGNLPQLLHQLMHMTFISLLTKVSKVFITAHGSQSEAKWISHLKIGKIAMYHHQHAILLTMKLLIH